MAQKLIMHYLVQPVVQVYDDETEEVIDFAPSSVRPLPHAKVRRNGLTDFAVHWEARFDQMKADFQPQEEVTPDGL